MCGLRGSVPGALDRSCRANSQYYNPLARPLCLEAGCDRLARGACRTAVRRDLFALPRALCKRAISLPRSHACPSVLPHGRQRRLTPVGPSPNWRALYNMCCVPATTVIGPPVRGLAGRAVNSSIVLRRIAPGGTFDFARICSARTDRALRILSALRQEFELNYPELHSQRFLGLFAFMNRSPFSHFDKNSAQLHVSFFTFSLR